MTKLTISNKTLGLISIIAGILLFLLSASGFVFKILGALIAIILINYGLEILGYPKIQDLFFHFSNQLIYHLNKFKK